MHADTLPPGDRLRLRAGRREPTPSSPRTLAFHETQKFGDLSFDLECPDRAARHRRPARRTAIKQARLRLDNVPSFQATYATTAAGTTIGLQSDAPGLSIGGTQLQISTADRPPAPWPADRRRRRRRHPL